MISHRFNQQLSTQALSRCLSCCWPKASDPMSEVGDDVAPRAMSFFPGFAKTVL